MAALKNYYQVLGVPETAKADEIKRAYRKLAKKYHPDATGGDKSKEARFKEISEAYEELGDEKKRSAYDEARRNPFAGRESTGSNAGGFHVDLNDLFSQFGRGGAGRRPRAEAGGGGGGGFTDFFSMFGGEAKEAPRRGEDVVAKLEVELPEAALGTDKTVTVDGKRLTVKIPPGVTSGTTIRLAGQGEPGRHGTAGDLLIELTERPHPRFRRRQSGSPDIEVDVPIGVDTAVLGGKAEVPTLEGGTLTLTIPPGTSSGKKLRMRNKGAVITSPSGSPAGHGRPAERGDLYGVVSIQVPENPPPRARELIAEFARLTKK